MADFASDLPAAKKIKLSTDDAAAWRARKVALITGITGQDGSYLVELLLEKGYMVHGIIRRSSSFNTGRIHHLFENPVAHTQGKMKLHYGDMSDSGSMLKIIQEIQPTEVYNLAAMSHVRVSFDLPEYVADVDGLGVLRILEALRTAGIADKVRFYQASTSELYGEVAEIPQSEKTPFHPRSPYGVAKMYGFWIVVNYREAYGMHASNGILFNHESPRRGETFVTRKITRAVAKISLGQQEFVTLGNIDAKRDWGHAKDYVEAMWIMMQQETPDDYVIATGKTTTVRDCILVAFKQIGVDIVFEGEGVDEVGKDAATGIVRVKISSDFYRPAEVDLLLGDPAKAKKQLDWSPKVTFEQLIEEMLNADLELMKRDPTA